MTCPPLAPSSLCSSWDVVEQRGGEEERGRPHAGSPVSVCHGSEMGCPAVGTGKHPKGLSTLSCLHRGSLMAVPRTHVSALSHGPSSLGLPPSGQSGPGDRRDRRWAATPG